MKPIERAINYFGGLSKFAKAMGVKPPSVLAWRDSDKPVPIIRCIEIEKATNGTVTRKDLRPRDYHIIWPELVKKIEKQ